MNNSTETISDTTDNTEWRILEEMGPFTEKSPAVAEPWTDFPDEYEELDENEPDVDGVPQTVWRGERLYLHNIDNLGTRTISTKEHQRRHNREGQVYLSRDKKYASLYAVGTDGVKFYDGPLPVEEIPIGVVYKINNSNNHLHAQPTQDEPDNYGPFPGKFREFIAEEVPPEDYVVSEIYIMDDFIAADPRLAGEPESIYKYSGHVRSDFRRPMEVYRVQNQEDLPQIIQQIKTRMLALDEGRKK